MRQIKFRAWDESKKQMVYTSKERTVWAGGLYASVNVDDLGSQLFSTEHVMQYTGLKDKNGKEIYEGDVLAVFDRNGDGNYDEENNSYYPERELSIVKWDSAGGFTLEWDYGDYDFTLLGWAIDHHDLEVEVIGNVFESPDLLK